VGKIKIHDVENHILILTQGMRYYEYEDLEYPIGLTHWVIEGCKPCDTEIVATIDIDLSEATIMLYMNKLFSGVVLHIGEHLEDKTPVVFNEKEYVTTFGDSVVDIVLNYLPVDSEEVTCFYTNARSETVVVTNYTSVFITSVKGFIGCFEEKMLSMVGDDLKFRLSYDIHIVLRDHVSWQRRDKSYFPGMENSFFDASPVDLDLRLSIEGSSNSIEFAIDSIRYRELVSDRGFDESSLLISVYTNVFSSNSDNLMMKLEK